MFSHGISRSWLPMLLVMAFAVAALIGCAGTAEIRPTPPTNATVPVRATIEWPDRSRAIEAPSAALSARITVFGALPDGTDLSFVANRGNELAAFVQTYTSLSEARVGTWTFLIEFFALADAGGDVVGRASGVVQLSAANQDLGTVTTESEIASIAVTPGQELAEGERRTLLFQALNSEGDIVAITEGSVTWSVADGNEVLAFENGEAVALAAGTATVVATVNGIASDPVSVTVTGSSVATGRVLFQRGDELWLIDADGSNERLIFTPRDGISDIHTPDLHPTDTRVLFKALTSSGTIELFEYDYAADTLESLTQAYSVIQLYPYNVTRNPAYSVDVVDGERIYFDYLPRNQPDTITFIRRNGTTGGMALGVQPSAVGDLVASSTYRGAGTDARINLKYFNTGSIAEEGRTFQYPSLVDGAVDGVELAWQDQDGRLYVARRVSIASNGTPFATDVRVITSEGVYRRPSLSPDGLFLVAEKETGAGTVLVVMRSDGSEEQVLAAGADPTWR